MTTKIEFFYTHGHSYTANGVDPTTISHNVEVIKYANITNKESLDIEIVGLVTVQKHDLKFAIIHYGDDSEYAGCTTILHGLVGKFDILATFAEAEKIRKLEAEERETQERIAYKRQREAEKYVVRRQKRSADRKAEGRGDKQSN